MSQTENMENNIIRLSPSRFPDQHFHIKRCTFGEKTRNDMDKKEKERQRNKILQSVCALLNSGGGVITVGIENNDYVYKTMALGEDIEGHLTQLVNPSVMEDFIEFIPSGNTMQLYVKSWCQNGQRARLCSIDSGLLKRSGTSARYINPNGVLDFIKKKPKLPFRQPIENIRMAEGNTLMYQKAQAFYNEEKADLDQSLDFGESANVEFKSFEANLVKNMKEALPKYVSAFANTTGGFLFIGVKDETKTVVGCGEGMAKKSIENKIKEIVKDCEKEKAFHLSDCDRNSHWSVGYKVFKVLYSSNEKPRYVIAFKIPAFCCAVFEEDPNCWHVENDTVVRLDKESWLEKMQLSDPVDELTKRFQNVLSLKDSPPQCRPVYSTQNITQLQERIFPVQEDKVKKVDPALRPEQRFETDSNFKNIQTTNLVDLNSGPGVLVMSTSWAVHINLPRNNDILCEALLISRGRYPTLFSWVERESVELWKSVKSTAFSLKQKLVNLGGYTGRLCVIPKLVDCQTGKLIHNKTDDAPLYPESYSLDHEEEVKALLKSLTIVLLHFTSPMNDALGCEFFNLLTEEQFKILNWFSGIKHLFIHGPPGSGKTLIALEKMQMIKNSDNCDRTNILYLCESVGLRDFVRSRKQSLCLCETRASFMKDERDFKSVKHIIVDEGQNFRTEDGDWYKKAKSLIEGKHGVFWIFLDYFQKSHTEEDGLPPLKEQEKAYLTQVVRNSTEIFDFLSELIRFIADNSKPEQAEHLREMREVRLSHLFKGEFVRKTNLSSVEEEVVKIVTELLGEGHSARDIAVLYSNQVEFDEKKITKERWPVQFGKVDDIDQDKIVLDTTHSFSGLERNIVIVVDPLVRLLEKDIQLNFLLSAVSRARIRLYLIQSASQKHRRTQSSDGMFNLIFPNSLQNISTC